MQQKTIAIIGGGAAGFFAAINAKRNFPDCDVQIFEATRRPLTKILISGGGRCNVTHNCFESKVFVKNYPRGSQELLSLFSRFQAEDMVQWLKEAGVELHAEADGRMFPVTNKSETIANLFLEEQKKLGISLNLGYKVEELIKKDEKFIIAFKAKGSITVDKVLLATGSTPFAHSLAQGLGHTITETCPSLFTFKIKSPLIDGLMGLSFPQCNIQLKVDGEKKKFEQLGPVLITHWGLSGPAVLKLSAFAARELWRSGYRAQILVNWLGQEKEAPLQKKILEYKQEHGREKVFKSHPFSLTRRFWESLLSVTDVSKDLLWADLSKKKIQNLMNLLIKTELRVEGKGVFKEEFVTAGGVSLKEVNCKTMESKVCSGLYFAGEVLDIDGITGGFNFQNAWSGAWVVAKNIGT